MQQLCQASGSAEGGIHNSHHLFKGVTIFNYLNKKWDNIKQSYLTVLVAFPDDPGPAEEEMCIK